MTKFEIENAAKEAGLQFPKALYFKPRSGPVQVMVLAGPMNDRRAVAKFERDVPAGQIRDALTAAALEKALA